jgi:hypothetical protein
MTNGSGTPHESAWNDAIGRADFERAWEISDAVLQARKGGSCWHLPRHQQWIWDGRPLGGCRVLVRCYHGLGDTIQFIRYAAPLKAFAARVIVWAQPALLPLLRTSRGIDELLPLHDGAPDARYDADVEIMELPHVFRTTVATIPAEIPYLYAEPARLAQDGRLQVGLLWSAGNWDPRRTLPFSLARHLAEVPGLALHCLQRGPALAETAGSEEIFASVNPSDDIMATASLVSGLDLVITVDTMAAHLAGALGVPVWVLLRHSADWRWMTGRGDSPWYPTMRLFRQTQPGEWGSVLKDVKGELCRLSAASFRRPSARSCRGAGDNSRRPGRLPPGGRMPTQSGHIRSRSEER